MTKPNDSLLSEIILFRNECRAARKTMIPAADPTGDARLAFKVVADQLTELIKRYGDEAMSEAKPK